MPGGGGWIWLGRELGKAGFAPAGHGRQSLPHGSLSKGSGTAPDMKHRVSLLPVCTCCCLPQGTGMKITRESNGEWWHTRDGVFGTSAQERLLAPGAECCRAKYRVQMGGKQEMRLLMLSLWAR